MGATHIGMDAHAFLYIAPLKTISANDDPENIKKDTDTTNRITAEISEYFSRWPQAQILFDGGEEHFITREDAIAMGIIRPAITGE